MDIFLEKQFLFPPLYIRVQNMVKKEKKRKKKTLGENHSDRFQSALQWGVEMVDGSS